MNLKHFIPAILTLFTATLYGQEIKKCDNAVLHAISENIGKLKEIEIRNFLYTFGAECQNNVEYLEWSNELLFDLLDRQASLTLKTIEAEESKIELNEILRVIASPLLDEDVDKMIKDVSGSKINDGLKQRILEQLKIAKGLIKK